MTPESSQPESPVASTPRPEDSDPNAHPWAGPLHVFDSLPGRALGHYQVLEAIGVGTTGTVYRGRDLRVGRLVALKVLPPALAAHPDSVRRFRQEATCLSTVVHPNLVTFFTLEEDEGLLFLVMEHVSGPTLAACLPATGFPVETATGYARQIAAGLAAAHAQGIIHRDLKLSNVLVSQDGTIKIADFGLAKVMHSAASVRDRTREGMILGTVDYMSPEQVRGIEADARSDVFSFGILLFELLTGERPFHRPSSPETWAAILKEEPPDRHAIIPEPVHQVLSRCLSKDPAARFQSARELVDALTTLGVLQNGIDVEETERPKIRPRSMMTLVAALGLTLVGWSGYRLIAGRVSAADDRLTPTVHFERGIESQKKAEATGCFKDRETPCSIEKATSQLQQAVAEFQAALNARPSHASSLWNEALAEEGLCELKSRLKQWSQAQGACEQAIAHFTQALAPGTSYEDMPSRRPEEADVLWNRAITQRMRAQLANLDNKGKRAALVQAISDIDRVLHYDAFLQKRASEIVTYRGEIQQDLAALSVP